MITKESADRAIRLMEVERDRLAKAVEKAKAKEDAIIAAPRELLELRKKAMSMLEKRDAITDFKAMAADERRLLKLMKSDMVKAMDATFAAESKLRDFGQVIDLCAWHFRAAQGDLWEKSQSMGKASRVMKNQPGSTC